MPKRPVGPGKPKTLRQRPEMTLGTTKQPTSRSAVKEVQQQVHELQVHQVELETQNEELRRAQLDLQAAHGRYVELYDFSPAGHLTLDIQGKIIEANLRAAALLEVTRKNLIGEKFERFIEAEDQGIFVQHRRATIGTGLRQSCQVRLRRESANLCWITLDSMASRNESGTIMQWRTAMLDVTEQHRAKQDLLAQERQLEAIIESAMDAIITLDDKHRVVLFNRAAESIFGCPAADAIGESLDRFIPERYREAHEAHFVAFSTNEQPSRSMRRMNELRGLRITGEEFPIEASISRATVNNRVLLTVILRDITERKSVDEALEASDRFIRAVLDSLSALICVLSSDGVIFETNEAWKEFSQANSDGARLIGDVGDNYLDVCRRAIQDGESAFETILRGIESVLAGEQSSFSTEYACHSPRAQRWFLLRVTQLKGTRAIVLSHTEVSERVRMARALEDHVALLAKQQTELESLAGKLIQAQEQERRRIARELHDDFNQRLAALAVELETIERTATGPAVPIVGQLATIRGQVGRLSDDLHDMAYRLHPSLLDHVGLEVALRDHIGEFAQRTGLPAQFVARDVPGRIKPELATGLFRVAQESLQNVLKHAQATEVIVRLSGSSRGIGLSIRDNGKGFDASNKRAHMKGLGLHSMHERMRLLGGLLRVQSFPSDGTKVCAWVRTTPEVK